MNNPLIKQLLDGGFYGKDFDELDKLRSGLKNIPTHQPSVSNPYLSAGLEIAKKYSVVEEDSYEDDYDVYSDFEVDSKNFWGKVTGGGSVYNIGDQINNLNLLTGERRIEDTRNAPLPFLLSMPAGVHSRDVHKEDFVIKNSTSDDDILAKKLNKSKRWVRSVRKRRRMVGKSDGGNISEAELAIRTEIVKQYGGVVEEIGVRSDLSLKDWLNEITGITKKTTSGERANIQASRNDLMRRFQSQGINVHGADNVLYVNSDAYPQYHKDHYLREVHAKRFEMGAGLHDPGPLKLDPTSNWNTGRWGSPGYGDHAARHQLMEWIVGDMVPEPYSNASQIKDPKLKIQSMFTSMFDEALLAAGSPRTSVEPVVIEMTGYDGRRWAIEVGTDAGGFRNDVIRSAVEIDPIVPRDPALPVEPTVKKVPGFEKVPGSGEGRSRAVDPELGGADPELKDWITKAKGPLNIEGMPRDVAERITPEQAETWRKVSPESKRLIEGLVRDQAIELGEWEVGKGGKPKGSNLQMELDMMSSEFLQKTIDKMTIRDWNLNPGGASTEINTELRVRTPLQEVQGPPRNPSTITPEGTLPPPPERPGVMAKAAPVVNTTVAVLGLLYGIEAFLQSSEDFEWEDITEGLGGEWAPQQIPGLDPLGLKLSTAQLKSLFLPSSMSEWERQAMVKNRYGVNMWAITEFLKGLGEVQMGGQEAIDNMTVGNLMYFIQSKFDPRVKWAIMKEIPQSLNDVLVAPLLSLTKRMAVQFDESTAAEVRQKKGSTPMGQYPPQVWE